MPNSESVERYLLNLGAGRNPKYPDIHVQLTGEDGNAYFIMSRVASALRKAGIEQPEIDEFYKEAKSSDYANVLKTTMKWVNWS